MKLQADREELESTIEITNRPVSRRQFLQMSLRGLGLLAALEVGGAGLLFLQPRENVREVKGRVLAGLAEAYPKGSVTEFQDGRFFLVRTDDGGFLAIYRRCPHLGCTVNWQPQTGCFYCPCHASSFDLYGEFEEAPAVRPLDIFPITIEAGELLIDTSETMKRTQFSQAQLVYP